MDSTLLKVITHSVKLLEERNEVKEIKVKRRLRRLHKNLKAGIFEIKNPHILSKDLNVVVALHQAAEPNNPYKRFRPGLFHKNQFSERPMALSALVAMLPLCKELALQHAESLMFSNQYAESSEYRALHYRIVFLEDFIGHGFDIPKSDEFFRDAYMLSLAYLSRVCCQDRFADLAPNGFGSRYCY